MIKNMTRDDLTAEFMAKAQNMLANSKMHEDNEITPNNVYQPAHKANRDQLFDMVNVGHLPGSTILGAENINKLYDLAQQGKSCLILSEHVSNLDVPSLFVRFYDQGDERFKKIFEKIIFIAGVKLNENAFVKLFTEMFSRVVIFPILSMDKIKDNEEALAQVRLARKINIKATRKIKELRNQGNIFLVYPSGTRYRPWKPETKRGLKEITSYVNSFDYFCCCSINGNNMVPEEHEDMTGETFRKDVIVFNFGEVQDASEYIHRIQNEQHFNRVDDLDQMKQYVIDRIVDQLDDLHKLADEYIAKL